eukprot:5502225-Alexandrium_andersonii.AAC.1
MDASDASESPAGDLPGGGSPYGEERAVFKGGWQATPGARPRLKAGDDNLCKNMFARGFPP